MPSQHVWVARLRPGIDDEHEHRAPLDVAQEAVTQAAVGVCTGN